MKALLVEKHDFPRFLLLFRFFFRKIEREMVDSEVDGIKKSCNYIILIGESFLRGTLPGFLYLVTDLRAINRHSISFRVSSASFSTDEKRRRGIWCR